MLTNNPIAAELFSVQYNVEFFDEIVLVLLMAARDYVHLGHKLLTHPQASSIAPNQNPYRSLIITDEAFSLDLESLKLIEAAIAVYSKINTKKADIPQDVAKDFMVIDCEMIKAVKLT